MLAGAGILRGAQEEVLNEAYGSSKRTQVAIGALVMKAVQVRGLGSGPWDLLAPDDDGSDSYFASPEAEEMTAAPPAEDPQDEPPEQAAMDAEEVVVEAPAAHPERGAVEYLSRLVGSTEAAGVRYLERVMRQQQQQNAGSKDMLTVAKEAATAAKEAFDRARQEVRTGHAFTLSVFPAGASDGRSERDMARL